jgi:tetratricopeptide (TPR) repeat protein
MELTPAQQLERAKQHFELHDYHGAIHLIEELVEQGKAFADAHNLLGLSYQMINQGERALAAFDRALQLNPRYVEALINRGVVLAELGRDDEASAAFTAARGCGGGDRGGVPAHFAAKLANLHAALGDAYAQAGALDRAVEQYRAALQLGPTFHDLRYKLGRYLLDTGRSLEAREELDAVVQARPASVQARTAFALACFLSGDGQTARRALEQVLSTHPDHVRARVYLQMVERAGAR